MKRNDAEQIGKLIQQYLRQESLSLLSMSSGCWMPGRRCWDRRQAIPVISISVTRRCMYIHFRRPSSGTDDGTGTSGAYSESESRGYGYHKHYFSLRKGILSVTFIPSFGASHLPGHSRTEFPDIGCCGHPPDNGSAAFVRCYFPKIRVGNGCYSMFVVVIFVAYIIFQGRFRRAAVRQICLLTSLQ